jgi:hypothetical protein
VADFLHRAVTVASEIKKVTGSKLKDFEDAVKSSEAVAALKHDVQVFITQFPMPGFDTADMRYKEIA